MKNLTEEQIERINEVFESIGGGQLTEEETIAMYGSNTISLEDKIEDIWQYYDCAGFDIATEEDLFRFLDI